MVLSASLSCTPSAPLNVNSSKPTTNLSSKPSDSQREKKLEHVKTGDFTIVGEVTSEDLASLEEVLDTPVEGPGFVKEVEFEFGYNQYPEVAYCVDLEKKQPISAGSTFILNDKGFLLSAYHVFERCLDNKERKMLIYDPVNNSVFPAEPLVYSKEYDILLGKIDARELKIETSKIANSDKSPADLLYLVTYRNTDYISEDLVKEILEDRKAPPSGKEHYRKLGLSLVIGHPVKLTLMGNKDIPFRDGDHLKKDYYAFQADVIPGNSGTPVLNGKNQVVGVLNHRPNKNAKVGIYTGPYKIREMIRTYIDFIKMN